MRSERLLQDMMKKDMFDSQVGYCRMLGHDVQFSYCRVVKEGLPCHKILDCWFQRIPVKDYVEQVYSVDEQGIIFSEPANRLVTLYDLILKASARKQPDE